jgi:hypothetical protein
MVNKQGQFFILAAVIIAVAVIGLGVVYNSVYTDDSPKKFFKYSEVLEDETGAVVDYSLYSGQDKIAQFINESIGNVYSSYPDFQVFACYSESQATQLLTCKNYGIESVRIYSLNTIEEIPAGNSAVTTSVQGAGTVYHIPNPSVAILNIGSNQQNITANIKGYNYTIDLRKASSSQQYYFIFRSNNSVATAG